MDKELKKAAGMASEKSKENQQDPSKELKKLFDSHVAVMSHKLGRTPSLEEIMAEMDKGPQEGQALSGQGSENSQQADDMPKLLSYKIYYGMKDGQDENGNKSRQPDPTNILFYHDPSSGRFYDVNQRAWMDAKPDIADHLPERDLEDQEDGADIRDAIIHGVMEDDDFQKLQACPGMIDDRLSKLYDLMKQLKDAESALSTMTKSEDVEEQPEIDPTSKMEDKTDQVKDPNSGVNVVDSYMDTAGIPSEDTSVEDDPLEVEDLPENIKQAAKGSGIEHRIRRWIREELEKIKEEIRAEMWAAINSSVEEEIRSGESVLGEMDDVMDDIPEDELGHEAEASNQVPPEVAAKDAVS